jgi:hypothetical protein
MAPAPTAGLNVGTTVSAPLIGGLGR